MKTTQYFRYTRERPDHAMINDEGNEIDSFGIPIVPIHKSDYGYYKNLHVNSALIFSNLLSS